MGQFKLVGNGYLEQCFRRDTEVVPDPEETNFSNVCHEHQKMRMVAYVAGHHP